MASTIELKIYQDSPAPTPKELREGICILLDTFGHTTNYAFEGQEPFTYQQLSGKLNLEDDSIGRIVFKSSIGSTDSGCVGMDIQTEKANYGYEIHDDPETDSLTAVKHSATNNGVLSDEQRKRAGELVLATWLNLEGKNS